MTDYVWLDREEQPPVPHLFLEKRVRANVEMNIHGLGSRLGFANWWLANCFYRLTLRWKLAAERQRDCHLSIDPVPHTVRIVHDREPEMIQFEDPVQGGKRGW